MMNEPPDPQEGATAKAGQELARLNGQVGAMRSLLVQLLQDVVRAESRLDSSQTARLLEANEKLIVTALEAQAKAETASGALDEASRSHGLDPLTELPNRALLLERLERAISNARRHGNRVALLFLDLNNFKQINDTFGHAVGDQALELAADCLASLVRETDTVSRHGGDEFLILLAEISHAADAALIAEKVNAALGRYSRIDGHAVRLSASIGISIYPEDGDDAKTLINRADAAMYVAKKHPLGGFSFHADQSPARPSMPELSAQSQQRLTHLELAMTEHESWHAQLREANAQLVVAALGAQELQAAAEQARRRQTELLAVVAQELSNPFAPIRIAASMLGRLRPDEPLLPRAQAVIEQHVDQISQLVSSLVDPASGNEGGVTLDRTRFDVAGLIDDAVRACQVELNRRLQTLDVEISVRPLDVHADRTLLSHVLTNLLSNAMAYTRNGGRIKLSVEIVNDTVKMIFSDSGIGIRPEALPTIFDPFVRDPHAVAINDKGLGIGLTVVRAIVEAHGGSVVAASVGSEHGSQFVVSLPLAPNRAAARA